MTDTFNPPSGSMALRDYFAAKALQGLLAGGGDYDKSHGATEAYEWADAMLMHRNDCPCQPPEREVISGLGLPTKTMFAIEKHNIYFVDELTKLCAFELQKFRGLGKLGLKSVRERLAERGLHLRGETLDG